MTPPHENNAEATAPRPGQASRVIVGTALLNLVLTFILTPTLGIMGTALTSAAAGFARLDLLRWLVRRHVGVPVLPSSPAEPRMAGGA